MPFTDDTVAHRAIMVAQDLMANVWPFDFGRFELRYNPDMDQISFLELNMSCNLSFEKALSLSWQSMGFAHEELIETILVGSMLRQSVISETA